MSGSVTTSLVYNGLVIRDRDQMLCLTDMWKAAGAGDSQRPANWLQLPATDQFCQYIAASQNVEFSYIIQSERGRTGGTWAHWQVGMAYAQYLSPAFHAWCNSVVRSYMEGQLVPTGGALTARDIAMIEQVASRVVAPLVERMDQNFQQTWGAQQEIRQEISGIGERVRLLERFLPRRRKNPSESTKAQIAWDLVQLGCRCPCCGLTDIVGADGTVINGAEFDHFFGAQHNEPEHMWLICRKCHLEITHSDTARSQRNDEFRSFQGKRSRLRSNQ